MADITTVCMLTFDVPHFFNRQQSKYRYWSRKPIQCVVRAVWKHLYMDTSRMHTAYIGYCKSHNNEYKWQCIRSGYGCDARFMDVHIDTDFNYMRTVNQTMSISQAGDMENTCKRRPVSDQDGTTGE